MKNVFKNKKYVATGAIALILLGAVSGMAYVSQAQQKITQAQDTVDNRTLKLTELETEIGKLVNQEDPAFLAKDVTQKQIDQLQKVYDKETKAVETVAVSSKKLKKDSYTKIKTNCQALLETATEKLATQQAMNDLYQQDDKAVAMNGSDVKKDLPIANDLKKETVETAKTDYFTDKEEDAFHKTVNELIINAENQLKQIATAKTAVEKVFKDNKVVSTDKKLYDEAKTEVDKIKNEEAKKSLLEQLDKVKIELDKKEKENAEKAKNEQEAKAAEQQKATEQAQDQQAATEAQQQAQGQAATDQGQSNGYTDNGGGYVAPASGGNTGGGYTPPASGGGSSSTGGGQTTTPPTGGGNTGTTYPEYPTGNQGGELPESGSWEGGWSPA